MRQPPRATPPRTLPSATPSVCALSRPSQRPRAPPSYPARLHPNQLRPITIAHPSAPPALPDQTVSTDLKQAIIKARNAKGLTQKALAQAARRPGPTRIAPPGLTPFPLPGLPSSAAPSPLPLYYSASPTCLRRHPPRVSPFTSGDSSYGLPDALTMRERVAHPPHVLVVRSNSTCSRRSSTSTNRGRPSRTTPSLPKSNGPSAPSCRAPPRSEKSRSRRRACKCSFVGRPCAPLILAPLEGAHSSSLGRL